MSGTRNDNTISEAMSSALRRGDVLLESGEVIPIAALHQRWTADIQRVHANLEALRPLLEQAERETTYFVRSW